MMESWKDFNKYYFLALEHQILTTTGCSIRLLLPILITNIRIIL
jgi:hypothetical protein